MKAPPPIQRMRELTISLMASLAANPINDKNVKQKVRDDQFQMVDEITDWLLVDSLNGCHIWDLVPPDLRQLMLLAGFAAIGSACGDAEAAPEDIDVGPNPKAH